MASDNNKLFEHIRTVTIGHLADVGILCDVRIIECYMGVADAEKAFDKAWHNGIRFKLLNFNLPSNYTRLFSSFLRNRKVKIHYKNHQSNFIDLNAGTPQGAVLSPLLYTLFVNDLNIPPLTRCNFSQYADDIAVWSTSKNINSTELNIGKAVSHLEKWCSKWRIKINPSKSKLVNFSFRNSKHRNHVSNIHLFNTLITASPSATFLGITFDSKLSFKLHCSKTAGRCWSQIKYLHTLSYKYDFPPKTLIHIYHTKIKPALSYGSISLLTISDSNKQILNRIHTTAYRHALKIPSYIGTVHVLNSANTSPLFTLLEDFNIKIYNNNLDSDPVIKDLVLKYQVTAAHFPNRPNLSVFKFLSI